MKRSLLRRDSLAAWVATAESLAERLDAEAREHSSHLVQFLSPFSLGLFFRFVAGDLPEEPYSCQ
jgi:hypothetical protein